MRLEQVRQGFSTLTDVSGWMTESRCREEVRQAFQCTEQEGNDLFSVLVLLKVVFGEYDGNGDARFSIDPLVAGDAFSVLRLVTKV